MAPPAVGTTGYLIVPKVTEMELAAAVLRLKAKNTAPGPDGLPGKAWVLAMDALEPKIRSLFTACLAQAIIPQRWKTGKLVLLRKTGRSADSPSAYRPIVLLDEVAKLFERVVAGRLISHLEETGPGLSDTQYGFRRGRSTVDAVLRVKSLTQDAVAHGEVIVAVSLDITNAFNSLPWSCVREALRFHEVPTYLRRVIEAYLSDRAVVYPTQQGWKRREMSCGVPQGSVLGPILWNIGYDWTLRGSNLRGINVVCYADDTLVTAREATYRQAAILATVGVAHIVRRIRRLGLEVALPKSEALCFHGPRRGPPPNAHIVVDSVPIVVKSTMKYLGLVLDSRWHFRAHFIELVPRLMKTAAALGRLLPNLGGPNLPCRRLYMEVVRSIALYGAPVWADALTRQNIVLLRQSQRTLAIRVIRGYCTISGEAACVLAGTLPWDLDAVALASLYQWRRQWLSRNLRPAPRELEAHRAELRDAAVSEWLLRLENPYAGLRTVGAVRPILKRWIDRRHGLLTFRMTQFLSGHGCFGRYLCRVTGGVKGSQCRHCDGCPDETAQHALEECPAWAAGRRELIAAVGTDLSLPTLVHTMVDSDRSWRAMSSFCEAVMIQKEITERRLEDVANVSSHRRRVSSRRAAQDRRPP